MWGREGGLIGTAPGPPGPSRALSIAGTHSPEAPGSKATPGVSRAQGGRATARGARDRQASYEVGGQKGVRLPDPSLEENASTGLLGGGLRAPPLAWPRLPVSRGAPGGHIPGASRQLVQRGVLGQRTGPLDRSLAPRSSDSPLPGPPQPLLTLHTGIGPTRGQGCGTGTLGCQARPWLRNRTHQPPGGLGLTTNAPSDSPRPSVLALPHRGLGQPTPLLANPGPGLQPRLHAPTQKRAKTKAHHRRGHRWAAPGPLFLPRG